MHFSVSVSGCAASLLQASILLTPFLFPNVACAADDTKKSKPVRPCTARSANHNRFFDLNPIWVKPPEDGKKKSKDERTTSWSSNGYDIGYNFTINFCGPVVEKLENVVGVEKDMWRNISAFYEKGGKTYSMGMQNAEPVFRGKKLVLNYTDGSPCVSSKSKKAEGLLADRALKGDDDVDDNDDDAPQKPKDGKRRKQTIISLLCENDALNSDASISFVAASEDECAYFFEARSSAACAGIEKEFQTVGPAGVFSLILFIAIAAYVVGGCVYQRNVMHQRGWRQLPNYALWAGIGSFIRDMFIILTSSCARFMPSRRGYSRVSLNGGRPRGHSEDENRLIDSLDEEWND
ncbi:mannose 6-phosphate receptor domain-containing protein [Pseudovirgaria hyperparasitica]|uniref:Mannose 6-phosphate receptor domain-containing protein n=1 Tax=Pseudovirgaria hyperparasitica TaxID=470096 RepID=A0A6A6W7S2_9PEZI|nr:mannose 6-phosphate receptor domain-containing protein [Pseudovirgaria hyperparasitica]KAF2757936.1 mannose 6-phosphate receptor domain-containing protein [Pseudovirgaria hyperparasitica]